MEPTDANNIALRPRVSYDEFTFPLANPKRVSAIMEKDGEEYRFYRIRRADEREVSVRKFLDGLQSGNSLLSWEHMPKQDALGWLSANMDSLQEMGIDYAQGDAVANPHLLFIDRL